MNLINLVIKIADLPLGFTIKNDAMNQMIMKRYQGYFYPKAKPVLNFNCSFTSNYSEKSLKPRIKRVGSGIQITRKDFTCHWTGNTGKARIYRSIYAFDALLRIVYATLLPEFGGMLLHASGTAKGNRAHVFGGRSGAGKTTISRLLKMKVLNDEIIAVKLNNSRKVKVYGTPFWGEMGTGPVYSRSFELVNLFFINKHNNDEKVPLSKTASLTRLLQSCCCFNQAPDSIDQLLRTGISIIDTIPSFQLNFTKTGRCADILESSS